MKKSIPGPIDIKNLKYYFFLPFLTNILHYTTFYSGQAFYYVILHLEKLVKRNFLFTTFLSSFLVHDTLFKEFHSEHLLTRLEDLLLT